MHPILFEIGSLKVYSYGFLIAIGAIAGVWYMTVEGKRRVGLSAEQANTLFLLIFIAAFVGGKAFLFFENPKLYMEQPSRLLSGKGFVFYGSFIFAVPTMLWFFRKHKLDVFKMLDVMAITTCLVHIFGRLGCFMAGCCYGIPTGSFLGVTFSHPACPANPKDVPLHPTQLYEAGFILLVMVFLFWLKRHKNFDGQLFLSYLMLYAVGRFIIEYFRGDGARGFVIENVLSHSQLIAILMLLAVSAAYVLVSKRNSVPVKTAKK